MAFLKLWQNKIEAHRGVYNFVWFKVFWFSAIIYQDEAILLALLVLYFTSLKQVTTHLTHYLLFAGIGICIDFFLYQQHVFAFAHASFPLWLALLWIGFATTIKAFLSFLQKKLLLAALLGLFAGPISYYFAMQLNAVSFPQPLAQTLIILAIIWAILLPLLLVLNHSLSVAKSSVMLDTSKMLSKEK
ncbi:DUF2878 domain-containing protein [Thalassomonas sp. M1454]|uniref:DUF2878 domain-containing protein n=1 Tax=Thalassomonas sp. M1454 TaxID=2594477 RepID=UPI00117D60D8|nr:DUF2878 domain-containing protein [Thalassomonas sp. M1454]TRX55053.1 DUF2878 domain-containing protein [Thalassomonas sp. M1454]